MARILIVDDDDAVRASLSLLVKQAGYQVLSAPDPDQALELLAQDAVDLVILDMNFSLETSGEEGLQLLGEIKRLQPYLPVVLITAWGSITLAVQGMRAGAADFITKPWQNDHLLRTLETALRLSRKPGEGPPPELDRIELDRKYDFSQIIGEDPALLQVLQTIGRVAATDAPVLIIGESGTGKELIAEALHRNSARRDESFVKVNLGGVSRSLFESEMFGHRKGAFTDAKQDRVGRFELADKGTIFLDEIGELDLNSQVKLLRVLQDRAFEVLGSSKTKTVDFRLVCATNQPLEELVSRGEFREDLFYRINLITVQLPSLRERPSDIPLLVNHFMRRHTSGDAGRKVEMADDAIQWLAELPWPGNIRELKNLIERAVLISDKELLNADDLVQQISGSLRKGDRTDLPAIGTMTLDEIERRMIQKALAHHSYNLSQVAQSLGISRGALYRKLEKYGLGK